MADTNSSAPAIAAGTGLAGPIIGGITAKYGVDATNAANATAAAKAQEFSEKQSGSQWTRAVMDMRNAGLNPALAYSQGGASAASGVTYTSQSPMAEMGRSISAGISSAGDIVRNFRESKSLDSTLRVQDSSVALNAASAAQAFQQAQFLNASRKKLGYETESSRVTSEADQAMGSVGKLIGRVADYIPFGEVVKKLPLLKGKK